MSRSASFDVKSSIFFFFREREVSYPQCFEIRDLGRAHSAESCEFSTVELYSPRTPGTGHNLFKLSRALSLSPFVVEPRFYLTPLLVNLWKKSLEDFISWISKYIIWYRQPRSHSHIHSQPPFILCFNWLCVRFVFSLGRFADQTRHRHRKMFSS